MNPIDAPAPTPDLGQYLLAELDALYRTARYLTTDPILAEDIVQEVSLKVMQGQDTFQPNANFRPWVFAILRNTITDYYRRQNVDLATVSLEGDQIDLPTGEALDSRLLEYVLDEEIEQALGEIPFEMRLAVLLADIEEFSYREIAEVLDWPLGSVMSRLHRGRKKLRQRLLTYAKRRGYAR
jgi:RNA polymerase sigma-70 factor (ECF subfamily)